MDALKTKIKSVSRSNFTNANKVAGDIVAHFVMTKFGNKPGEGGYMVNCKKGMDKRTITSLDVHFHLIATKNFIKKSKDKLHSISSYSSVNVILNVDNY